MTVDPVRRAAYDLLHEVSARDAYANLVWSGMLTRAGLVGRDAAFATELAYGTLRWRGRHDAVLAACVDRPLAKVDGRLLDVLRLGVHQLHHMRVPDHAAVGESVDLARSVLGDGPARMANAVLRKVTRDSAETWDDRIIEGLSGADALSVRWSHPVWIVRALQQALASDGADPERIVDVLRADNEPARPSLVARPGRASLDELLADPRVEPGRWSPYAATVVSGQPEDIAGVSTGAVGVQDEGSQLIALALAGMPVEGDDRAWLDVAAGPGGKAALLAAIADMRGATLTAVEQHAHRARLVTSTTRGGAAVIVGDSTMRPWGDRRFARVLADVPCTGMGALRRRPEARWRRTPSDLSTLRPLQAALLGAAVDAAHSGGVIMYSTCSPHPAETDLVIGDLLKTRTDVEQLDVRELLPVPLSGGGPAARLWPDVHGTDAMYLALLRRR